MCRLASSWCYIPDTRRGRAPAAIGAARPRSASARAARRAWRSARKTLRRQLREGGRGSRGEEGGGERHGGEGQGECGRLWEITWEAQAGDQVGGSRGRDNRRLGGGRYVSGEMSWGIDERRGGEIGREIGQRTSRASPATREPVDVQRWQERAQKSRHM